MNRHFAETLRTALTGGLHCSDDGGCSMEAVIANIAAAQLRAVRMAMLMGEPDDGLMEDGRGWCITDKFTKLDAVAAIGGVMALLQDSHYIASEVRAALNEADTLNGAEHDPAVLNHFSGQKAQAAE